MIYELLFSATGRTEKVMDIISGRWPGEKIRIDLSDVNFNGNRYTFSDNDICIVAVPVYGGRVPSVVAERLKKLQGNGAKVVLVAVFGNRAIDDTLLEMKDIMLQTGFVPVAAIESSVQHSIMPQIEKDRPDDEDRQELEKFADIIWQKINGTNVFSSLDVPGKHPYVKAVNIPLKPKAGKKCTECGLCAAKCPTGAISKNNPKIADKSRCITCMRCVEICPEGARNFPNWMVNSATKIAKPVLGRRKPNKLYIAD